MEAHNNVVSFKRDDHKAEELHSYAKEELHSYAKYATARALAAAIYEANISPEELFEAMCDHMEAML